MPPKPNFLLPKSTTATVVPLHQNQNLNRKPLHSLLPPPLNPNSTLISHLSSLLPLLKTTPHQQQLPLNNLLLPYLTNSTLSSILLLSQSHPLPSLDLFTNLLLKHHLTPSPLNFSILAHSLTFSHHYTHATHSLTLFIQTHPHHDILSSLLHSSSHCSLNSSPAVFDLLVKTHVRLGQVARAIETLRRVVQLGFLPSTHSFNRVLNCLVKAKERDRLDACWEIYDLMRRVGTRPNGYTFNVMILGLCRGGDEERANGFLEEIELEGFDPDVVTYNTLIDGYCRRKRLDEAMLLFRVMYRRGMEPDLLTYTVLIKGFCREGKVVEARKLFDRMVERGLRPDGFCFGVLIHGYCVKGMMAEARSILDELMRCGLKPDAFTCNALIEGYVKVGRLLPCLNMITELRKLGIVVSFDAYRSVLNALCLEKRPHAAKTLLDWMVQDGYQPNLEMYNLIIGSFCEHGNFVKALGVKEEMIDRDINPGLDTYQIIVRCLCRVGKVVEGECLIMEMADYNLAPDSVICAALVDGYLEQKDLTKGEFVLRYFAQDFQIYDNRSYNSLLKLYCEEEEMAQSFELQNRMMKLGFVPNAEACKLLIRRLSRGRNLNTETIL